MYLAHELVSTCFSCERNRRTQGSELPGTRQRPLDPEAWNQTESVGPDADKLVDVGSGKGWNGAVLECLSMSALGT